VSNARVLLAEAESGVAGDPVAVQPVPGHHDLVAALAEIRDMQAAKAVLPDRAPQEYRFAREQLAEDRDALLLNCEPVLEA